MRTDPIRDAAKIQEIKTNLREDGRLRDWVVFSCGISWALRVGDLLSLTVGDVMNGVGLRESFVIRQQKTGQTVRVDITNSCRDTLAFYLTERPSLGGHPMANDHSAPLFPSRKRNADGSSRPVTRQQLARIIRDACHEVGLTDGNWSTHTLRKTWGYHCYKLTKDIGGVQHKLGHQSPAATLRYLGLNEDHVRDLSEQVDAVLNGEGVA